MSNANDNNREPAVAASAAAGKVGPRKARFNALDVAATVNGLRLELRGMRLNNIYDIDNKTYLLKVRYLQTRFSFCLLKKKKKKVFEA